MREDHCFGSTIFGSTIPIPSPAARVRRPLEEQYLPHLGQGSGTFQLMAGRPLPLTLRP
jgi:hypothetical protein